jgi:hypothetical protein
MMDNGGNLLWREYIEALNEFELAHKAWLEVAQVGALTPGEEPPRFDLIAAVEPWTRRDSAEKRLENARFRLLGAPWQS